MSYFLCIVVAFVAGCLVTRRIVLRRVAALGRDLDAALVAYRELR